MKKYVYEQYSDRKGTGEIKVFNTKEEAVTYGSHEFDGLCEEDKKKLLAEYEEGRAYCRAYAIEVGCAEFEKWEDGDLDAPLEDYWTEDVHDWLKDEAERKGRP